LIKNLLGIEHLARGNVFKSLNFRASKYPSHVVLFVTARCNGRCRHCFYWKEISQASDARADRSQELSLEEINAVSKKMGHVEMLTITGGEPSLRDDVPKIIGTFYTNNATRHVTIHTNGLLKDQLRRMLVKIARACPLMEINVSLSIDGLKEIHDDTRGVEGAFDSAMQALRVLEKMKRRYQNLNITINTVFNRLNQDGVIPLINYIYSTFDIDGYYLALVRGATRDPGVKDVDIENYRTVIKHLEKWKARRGAYGNFALAGLRNAVDDLAPLDVIKTVLKGKNAYPCKAGQTVIVISERGEVAPCEMLGLSFGNLRDFDHDVNRILASPRARSIKKAIRGASCTCTWECAVMNNIVFNWRAVPRVLVQLLKSFTKKV
jgi:MoaA/NifB/PqqE/SkfB family radical SAM enzyme